MTSNKETPAELPPRRHRWNEPFTVAEETHSGCQETHRLCALCGLTKVTVHTPGGQHYRAWKTAAGRPWTGDATPPCLGEIT